ncbi:MAG: SMI1/KNR4 family protein [Armatimonadota bacterium]
MNNEFESLLLTLKRWEVCGEKILGNGTRMICHVPHIAPKAWLHYIYAGLEDIKIDEIRRKLGLELPKDFVDFLECSNGINIFSDSLCVFGHRTSYARTGDEAIQPYDLILMNEERKGDMPITWLLIGSYLWDGSLMLYDLGISDKKVYRCESDSYRILQEWDSLWKWLSSEVERLSELFDDNGIEYDENTPTVPV